MITFKVLARKNPRDITAQEKFYASVVSNGTTDLKTLSELISSQCTVTTTDCIAVLNTLEENIVRELKLGRTVKLGKIGTFRMSISSEGVETADEVNTKIIKKSRILFRPTEGLRGLLSQLTFKKVS